MTVQKSFVLFLIMVFVGSFNSIHAVRGHGACNTQRRTALQEYPRAHYIMTTEDIQNCTCVDFYDKAIQSCFGGKATVYKYRTRELANLKNVIRVGTQLRYFEPANDVISLHFRDRHNDHLYEYWKVVKINPKDHTFQELLVRWTVLTNKELQIELPNQKQEDHDDGSRITKG